MSSAFHDPNDRTRPWSRDDGPKWGASQTIALVLCLLDLDVVHRSTLRAFLPRGRVKRPKLLSTQVRGLAGSGRTRFAQYPESGGNKENVMSKKFQWALQRFHESGWITRGEEYVLVRDRRALMDWATASDIPDWVSLPLHQVVERINDDLRQQSCMTNKAVEQRRRELLAVQKLMTEGFGSTNWSGTGAVRFIPRSRPL